MRVYTSSEARQKLASVLDKAESTGKALIRRRDGRIFAPTPVKPQGSPLDIPSMATDMTTKEIVALVREQRENGRTARFATRTAPKNRPSKPRPAC